MAGRIEYCVNKYNKRLNPDPNQRSISIFKYSSNFQLNFFYDSMAEKSKQIIWAHLAISAKNHATKSIFNRFIKFTIQI